MQASLSTKVTDREACSCGAGAPARGL